MPLLPAALTAKLAGVILTALAGVVGIIILSLMLGGCTSTSPLIPDLYLLKITNNSTFHDTEVRLGYLGLCAGTTGKMDCTTRASGYALKNDTSFDSNPYIQPGKKLVTHVFTVTFEAIATAFFVTGVLLTIWHLQRIKQNGRLALIIASCYLLSALTQFLAFLAFWWASHALKYSSREDVRMDRGWAMFYLHIFMAIYAVVMMVPSCNEWLWMMLKKIKTRKSSEAV